MNMSLAERGGNSARTGSGEHGMGVWPEYGQPSLDPPGCSCPVPSEHLLLTSVRNLFALKANVFIYLRDVTATFGHSRIAG